MMTLKLGEVKLLRSSITTLALALVSAVCAPRRFLTSWASVVMNMRLVEGGLPSTVQSVGAWVCAVSARTNTTAACWKKPQKDISQDKYTPMLEHSHCTGVPIHDRWVKLALKHANLHVYKTHCWQHTFSILRNELLKPPFTKIRRSSDTSVYALQMLSPFQMRRSEGFMLLQCRKAEEGKDEAGNESDWEQRLLIPV